jgi:FkbM family methyltransferase
MTPELRIRSFSNDQYCLDKVFYANFYRLKAFKDPAKKPVVVDIGAHAGYFTFAALSLGAAKVYAFEPYVGNYKAFLKNLGDNRIGEVISYQTGIYTLNAVLDFPVPVLKVGSYFDFLNVGQHIAEGEKLTYCPCVTLDVALEKYIREPVDILKMSIGFADVDILVKSELIKTQVQAICGETELDEEVFAKFRMIMASKGFVDSMAVVVEGEEKKMLFHFSKTKLEDYFDLS